MGRRLPSRGKRPTSDDDEEAPRVIHTVSSDDDEANEDLTLEIVEKSRRREAKRKKAEDGGSAPGTVFPVIEISPASSDERELASDLNPSPSGGSAPALDREMKKKKKKKTKKIKQTKQPEETETTPVSTVEDQPMTSDEFVDNIANEATDNAVLRKLLRGPRYFDPGESNLSTCFNCGEEGHMSANCTAGKRDKPCFICGLFGHNSKQCMKEQACFVCKRSGHRAKDCPDKNKKNPQDSNFCLRCGDLGHDMFSCRYDYPAEDLKEIRCYICSNHGHLCCVDFMETGPSEVFCHNCAESGHTGSGCAKTRGESNRIASPAVCYKCHQEGHFARGCVSNTKPKSHRYLDDSSTPSEAYMDSPKFRSVPRHVGKTWQGTLNYEERYHIKSGKPRNSGGHSAHRQNHLQRQKFRGHPGASATTPLKGNHIDYSLNYDGTYSDSWSSKKRKPLFTTPNSHVSQKTKKHGSSGSRFALNSTQVTSELEVERERILRAGGFIHGGRVNGSLNLSRAIGDMEFKQNKFLPVEKQIVTANPDIQTVDLCDDDDFIVLACDGVWDCMSSQQLVDFIHERLTMESSLSVVCEKVFDRCLAPTAAVEGSDNMTMILVQFKKPINSTAAEAEQPTLISSYTYTEPVTDPR